MGDQPTTDERLSVLERLLFALLAQGHQYDSPIYRSLRSLLLEHPEERDLFRNREIESDPVINIFREASANRVQLGKFLTSLSYEIDDLRNKVDKLELAPRTDPADVLALVTELNKAKHELDVIWQDHAELLAMLSQSNALRAERFKRVLPTYVYLSSGEENTGQILAHSLENLAHAIGFERFGKETLGRGSWWKKSFIRAKEVLTKPEVQKRLNKAERALELKHVDLVQSEIDLNLANAACKMKEILENQDHAIVSLGSLFGVKTIVDGHSRLAIVSLTQEQMQKVKENPEMQTDPLAFFKAFSSSDASSVKFAVDTPRTASLRSKETTKSSRSIAKPDRSAKTEPEETLGTRPLPLAPPDKKNRGLGDA
jgi:hypothetical protein